MHIFFVTMDLKTGDLGANLFLGIYQQQGDVITVDHSGCGLRYIDHTREQDGLVWAGLAENAQAAIKVATHTGKYQEVRRLLKEK